MDSTSPCKIKNLIKTQPVVAQVDAFWLQAFRDFILSRFFAHQFKFGSSTGDNLSLFFNLNPKLSQIFIFIFKLNLFNLNLNKDHWGNPNGNSNVTCRLTEKLVRGTSLYSSVSSISTNSTSTEARLHISPSWLLWISSFNLLQRVTFWASFCWRGFQTQITKTQWG